MTDQGSTNLLGPIWARFPQEEFEIFTLDQVDRALMAQPDEPLRPGAEPGIVHPTGFFKVIYRPASGGEEPQAVAFLVPHSHQRGLSFWSFLATVAVVEWVSGLVFGFNDRLKRGGRQGFWLARRMPGGWSVRAPEAECAGGYRAEGWFPALSRDERRALCRASSFEPPAGPGDPEWAPYRSASARAWRTVVSRSARGASGWAERRPRRARSRPRRRRRAGSGRPPSPRAHWMP